VIKVTIEGLATILIRLLYLTVASVVLVALLTTLERGLPPALLSRLTSSSQAANLHETEEGTWTTYNTYSGLASNYVLSIAVEDGNMWFGTSQGVSKFDGENWKTYGTSDGLAQKCVEAIAIDEEGNKWFGTRGGVSKFDGTNWTTYDASNSGLALNFVSAIAIDREGNIWVGTCLDGYGYGVSKFDGEHWTIWMDGRCITAIVVDKFGNVWIGTSIDGVSKFDGERWTTYNTSNSEIASDHVRSIAVDSTDVKWFGGCTNGYDEWHDYFHCHASAVSRFDGTTWTSYIAGESGLVGREVTAIAIDCWEGNKWFGTRYAGVSKFDGVNWTTYDTSNSGLANDHVKTIVVDNEGNIWFGTYGGGVSKYSFSTPSTTPTVTATPTLTGTPAPTLTPTCTPTPTDTPPIHYLNVPLIMKHYSPPP
jgi:ligand-binding sensor domain-containing protein